MVAIVWWLDLPLPMQSVPITTNIVSSNPTHAMCTLSNIMWYILKFVSDLWQVFQGTQVSFINKTNHQYITEILLKVA